MSVPDARWECSGCGSRSDRCRSTLDVPLNPAEMYAETLAVLGALREAMAPLTIPTDRVHADNLRVAFAAATELLRASRPEAECANKETSRLRSGERA